MQIFNQAFTTRQYMVSQDYEYFHCINNTNIEVEYHNHVFYEIFILLSGKVTYTIEGKSYRLKHGDIVLINNNKFHKPVIDMTEKYERIVIWVNPDFLIRNSLGGSSLDMCFGGINSVDNCLIRPSPESYNTIMSSTVRLENAFNSISFGNSILRHIYILELLVNINKAFLESNHESVTHDIICNDKINQVIEYINNNLNKDLSLDALSSRFFVSKYHLLRKFKKYTGYTLHSYVQQKRLLYSKKLILEGNSVGTVCNLCGFEDYSNFIRSFKKNFGLSPKKYSRSL
ncbi:MAG: AraC family transcriptional regulator [Clostridia bacterium]|nr:AraC family transcriptional regulator [Clostridia bacterium]